MNDILFNKIKKANSKYAEYLSACDKVAKAAQKHINWNDNVSYRYCRDVIRWAFKQANRHHSCFIYVGVAGCQMIVSNNKRKLRRNRLKYVEKKRMFYNLLSRY